MVSLTAKPSAGLSPLIASQPSNFIHKSHTNRAKKVDLLYPKNTVVVAWGRFYSPKRVNCSQAHFVKTLCSCPILHLG